MISRPVSHNLRLTLNPKPIVSADSSQTVAPAIAAPVPPRAALAILGSMIFLILSLMGVLVQTTWGESTNGPETTIVLSS